jgi:predicted KAP-like P-loop ATPase
MTQYTKEHVQKFAEALEEACRSRDSTARVKLMMSPISQEYIAIINSSTGREVYAFNPYTGAWIICYNV